MSQREKQWIQTIETRLNRTIERNKKIDKYNVDGFDETTNKVYKFNGCFFHSCNNCYQADEWNHLTDESMWHHSKRQLGKNNN